MSSIRIPHNPLKPPPLCVKCKFYMPPPPHMKNDKTMGYCKKSEMIHLVTGELTYDNVEIYRKHECKGDLYQPN